MLKEVLPFMFLSALLFNQGYELEFALVAIFAFWMTTMVVFHRRRGVAGVTRGVLLALFFCFAGLVVWGGLCKASVRLATEGWMRRELARIQSPPNAKHFCFAVLADNKTGGCCRERVFVECLRRIQSDPDIRFVVHIGDAVCGVNPELYNRFYKTVKAHLKKPFLVAAGNHDIAFLTVDLYERFFGMRYYAFRYGDAGFVLVDGSYPWAFDAHQLRWLKETLKRFSNQRFIFVFQHQPLIDPRGGGKHHCLPESLAEKLADLYCRHGVACLFCSHVHGCFEGVWRGVRFYVTGGAGAALAGKDPAHFFYHYLKVRVSGDGFSVKVVKVPALGKQSEGLNWISRHKFEIAAGGRFVGWGGVVITALAFVVLVRRKRRRNKQRD